MNASQNLAVRGSGPAAKQVIAYSTFNETPIGVTNWTPGTGNTELGFTTAVLGQPGVDPILGTYDSSTSPRRFRMRSSNAATTFGTADISQYDGVAASIDILIKSTTYESGDYVLAILSNGPDGTEHIPLIDLSDSEMNSNQDVFLHYETMIPDSWTQATLTISSYTNSSAGAESVDFDNIFITGVPVPEPSTALMLLAAAFAAGWAWRRRAFDWFCA